jgi:H+/Cl- antiporter ClcA
VSDRRAYVRAIGAGVMLGLPVAFAAVLFLVILHEATDAVWHDLPDAAGWDEVPWWYLLAVPAAAGALVAAALRLPGGGGHPAVEGIGIHPLLPGQLPSALLAGIASLAGGVVLGPEAPMVALGLTLGLIAARLVKAGENETKLLALAGAFAAISSLMGGPIVSSLFLFEMAAASGVVAANRLGPALLPGFVAAGTGALVFTGIGSWPGVDSSELLLPGLPAYDTVRLVDVAWSVPVAAVAAAAVVTFARRGAEWIAGRIAGRTTVFLVGGGLAVGAIALIFRELADRPESLVLFSGQRALPAYAAETSAGVLVAILVAKGLAYAVSLGAEFRGGPIFPAAALGVALGALAAKVLPGLDLTPAIVAGLAAGSAAGMRLPFSGAVLAVIVAGSATVEAVPIAVLAAVTGWLVTMTLDPPQPQAATGSSAGDPAAAGTAT